MGLVTIKFNTIKAEDAPRKLLPMGDNLMTSRDSWLSNYVCLTSEVEDHVLGVANPES